MSRTLVEHPSKKTPSPEQQVVIESWGQGMAVLAGAGSGKTTTLVAKCARLTELKPESRFIAVSFTEKSAGDLKVKLSETLLAQNGPGSLNSHWIMTIHGLCAAVMREFPQEAGFDGEESVLTEPEAHLLWKRCIESLWTDELPPAVGLGFEKLLDRESRDGLAYLLQRVKELFSLGVMTSLLDSHDPDSQSLGWVSSYVLEKYERLKKRQGVVDFNDLERGADRALESPRVRESYHKRFDLVLVDEFQDTNPLQAKIISRIAQPDFSNLCVVGDPKQSIYRFRDADLTVFEEFCAQLPVRQSLTWNFRSLPGIIDFSNAICAQAFSVSQMNFEALVPKRQLDPPAETVFRLDVNRPEELGAWIQSEVAKGIPLHDMALLVRKVRGNEKWFRALTASGIPIAIGSGGLFREEPRVRELVAFLRWWDNPGNTLSGAIFLRAPWVGVSDFDLDCWIKEDPTWMKPFFRSVYPIALHLKKFTGRIMRPGELLMNLLIDQKTEDELWSPLLGLWHRAEEFSSKGLDFHGVVQELASSIRENRREREVPAPRNLGQLSILTLHGSKGLEFPHVILIDFSGKPKVSDMPLLFWDRVKGAYLGNRTEDGDRDRTHPTEAKWRTEEKAKNLAESKRLFYVALTRARDRLVFVFPEFIPKAPKPSKAVKIDANTPNPYLPSAYLQDDWRGWIESSNFPLSRLNVPSALRVDVKKRNDPPYVETDGQLSFNLLPVTERPGYTQEQKVEQKWSRARHSVTEWNLLARCPLAYEWKFIRPPLFDTLEHSEALEESSEVYSDQDYDKSLLNLAPPQNMDTEREPFQEPQGVRPEPMTQQELGSRVHACLEKSDLTALRDLEKEVGADRFSAEPIIQWVEKSAWMKPAEEGVREVWTELPFEVPWADEVLVGAIDRLVYDQASERYTIIDFKFTEYPRSVDHVIEAYGHQIELYAWAVQRLDPRVSSQSVSAYIVSLSAHSVHVLPMPLGNMDLVQIVREASRIVDGGAGQPHPGPLCRSCEFRENCPAQQDQNSTSY